MTWAEPARTAWAAMISGIPLTNGSRSRPTRGSSKTQSPFQRYGWITNSAFAITSR